MKSENNLTKGLIIISVLLLVVLEIIWIQKVFKDAKGELRRDVSILFERSVFSLQDSMIQKNMRSIPPDSNLAGFFSKRITKADVMFRRRSSRDTMMNIVVSNDSAKIQITYSDGKNRNDSLLLRPMLSRIKKDGRHRNFILRLTSDSLRIKDIRNKFKSALAKNDIKLPFQIKHITGKGVGLTDEGISILTEPVIIPPSESYIGQFGNLQGYLLNKVKLELLFVFFLTAITITAFTVMYRSLRSQQRLMELKNSFISNVTHELKTPIATVSVALEALQNFKGMENPRLTAEYLDIAKHELDRLSMLTEKVLTTSLFDEQGIKIEQEKMDLGNITDEILHSMKLVFEKQNAIVSLEKIGDNFNLEASTVHVTNVIYNLIDNALKYSPGNPVINLILQDAGEKILLTVSDKGQGIPKEYQKKIFEKFFRMPTGDVHNIKGYGLGLSYVEGVVKAHHGSIEVHSEPGKGNSFKLMLPRIIKG